MDRKVKRTHYDKPPHQRWLWKLSDHGFIKAMLIIWGICWIAIAGALLLVKAIIAFLNK